MVRHTKPRLNVLTNNKYSLTKSGEESICYEDLIYMAETASITYSYHREREEEVTKALDEFGHVRIIDELEYVAYSLTIRSEASINNSKKVHTSK